MGLPRPRRSMATMGFHAASTATAARVSEIGAKGRGKKNFERQFVDCLARLRGRAALADAKDALGRAVEDGDEEEQRRLRNEVFRLKAAQR